VTAKTKNISEPQTLTAGNGHLKTVALRTYSTHQKQPLDNEKIADFLPMVRKIVQRVVTYLKPPLSFEDMVSAGTLGLIKAARDFDPSHQAEFETYAYIRIKGAILDELRGLSLLPSNVNKQVQDALKTTRQITDETGRPPTDAEVADKLGIPVDKLYKTYQSARAQHFISIDAFEQGQPGLNEYLEASDAVTPDKQLEQAELKNHLADAIQQLDEKRRQVILLYYQQHLTMKQVADLLNITESRVSQLHTSAVFNLSITLRQWKDGR
jgi:RNA polymerase sigma factor for flagellar operon FliA